MASRSRATSSCRPKGARAWADEAEAEKLLRKAMRLKKEQMYDLS
jgi:hypothetical protein